MHASAFVHPGCVFMSLAGRAWLQFRGVGGGGVSVFASWLCVCLPLWMGVGEQG